MGKYISIVQNSELFVIFDNKNLQRWFGLLMVSTVPLLGIMTTFILGRFIIASSFVLFGLVIGTICYLLIEKTEEFSKKVRVGSLVLITAWSASLSLGYRFPGLVSGPL